MSSIMLRSFLLAIGCAAASASAAVGGRSSAAPHALILAGTITEGDAPSRFSQNIDLETGFTKLSKQMGASQSHSGFDGQPWEEGNGIVTVTNLPSAVADRRAFAWLDSTGWRLRGSAHETTRRIVPPGAKPIELSFDPDTGLLSKATVAGDWGPEVFTYGDWRKVGPFTYPFHREELSPVGEHTIIQVESARAERALQRRSFARPRSRSHAEWGRCPRRVRPRRRRPHHPQPLAAGPACPPVAVPVSPGDLGRARAQQPGLDRRDRKQHRAPEPDLAPHRTAPPRAATRRSRRPAIPARRDTPSRRTSPYV